MVKIRSASTPRTDFDKVNPFNPFSKSADSVRNCSLLMLRMQVEKFRLGHRSGMACRYDTKPKVNYYPS